MSLRISVTLIVTAVALMGCSTTYASKSEAEAACKRWMREGGVVWREIPAPPSAPKGSDTRWFPEAIRWCVDESETRAFRGGWSAVKPGTRLPQPKDEEAIRRENELLQIAGEKHFRY